MYCGYNCLLLLIDYLGVSQAETPEILNIRLVLSNSRRCVYFVLYNLIMLILPGYHRDSRFARLFLKNI